MRQLGIQQSTRLVRRKFLLVSICLHVIYYLQRPTVRNQRQAANANADPRPTTSSEFLNARLSDLFMLTSTLLIGSVIGLGNLVFHIGGL